MWQGSNAALSGPGSQSARALRLLSETQGLPSRPPLDPRPDAPALSSSPSVLPRLDPAWFPTQGPRLAPGTTVTGPSACVPSQERPGAGERERERVQEPSVWTVSVYYHVDTDGAGRGRPPRQDAGEGLRVAAHRQPRRARVTGRNHLGKRVTWGVFSINQRKCTLK